MAVQKVEVVETIKEPSEVNGSTKYWVKNLCNWMVGCARVTTVGDISIPPNGKLLITDEEIRGQIFNNNVLFVGENKDGSHARVYVENKDFRVDVGFETEKTKQKIIDKDTLVEIFNEKTFNSFKKEIESRIVTDSEKQSLVSYAKDNKINDYERIMFIEEYTGFKY